MSEPFVGEIRMFGGNYAPRGWALCDGQLLPVSQNDALFSLLGTTYGGDGRTTFGLPDMRGRLPLHQGHGPGLSDRRLGSKGGEEAVELTQTQIPPHNHTFNAMNTSATATVAGPPLSYGMVGVEIYAANDNFVAMAPNALSANGGSEAHDNLMPALCVSFIIALTGIYPSRH